MNIHTVSAEEEKLDFPNTTSDGEGYNRAIAERSEPQNDNTKGLILTWFCLKSSIYDQVGV